MKKLYATAIASGTENAIEIIQSNILEEIRTRIALDLSNEMPIQSRQSYILSEIVIPNLLTKHSPFNAELYLGIKNKDAYLWHRIPQMLDFGYTQGRALHNLRPESIGHLSSVSKASALLNLIIALYDYLLDEQAETSSYHLLSEELVVKLLGEEQKDALIYLDHLASKAIEPLTHLLLCSILSWIRHLNSYTPNGTNHAFFKKSLYQRIIDMFQAEQETSHTTTSGSSEYVQMKQVLYRKSVGPSLAICSISLLLLPCEDQRQRELLEKISELTGSIFWYIDDLCDLEKDLKNGAPNSILLHTNEAAIHLDSPVSFNGILRQEATIAILKIHDQIQELEKALKALSPENNAETDYIVWLRKWLVSWLSPTANDE